MKGTELIGERCKHYDYHMQFKEEREEDKITECYFCTACHNKWKWERGFTVKEQMDRFKDQLEEAKFEIFNEIEKTWN